MDSAGLEKVLNLHRFTGEGGVSCKMCFSLTFRGLAKWFIMDLVDILIFN